MHRNSRPDFELIVRTHFALCAICNDDKSMKVNLDNNSHKKIEEGNSSPITSLQSKRIKNTFISPNDKSQNPNPAQMISITEIKSPNTNDDLIKNTSNIDSNFIKNRNLEKVATIEKNQTLNKLNIKKKKYFFSIMDNICLIFCKCLATKRMKALDKYFDSLRNLTYKYTDVLNIVEKFAELEKIKLVIFNEHQLSLFNCKTNLINPLSSKKNKITELYRFNNDVDAQIQTAEDFLNTYINSNNTRFRCMMDKKLIELSKFI